VLLQYEGVSKSFRTESITNTREATQRSYGGKTHYIDSQHSDTTAPSGRELYHLQFSLRAASQSGNLWIHLYMCKGNSLLKKSESKNLKRMKNSSYPQVRFKKRNGVSQFDDGRLKCTRIQLYIQRTLCLLNGVKVKVKVKGKIFPVL
jgi:hypothetical protein